MKKGTLRFDVRRLKMSLLKLPNDKLNTRAVVFLLTIMLLPGRHRRRSFLRSLQL